MSVLHFRGDTQQILLRPTEIQHNSPWQRPHHQAHFRCLVSSESVSKLTVISFLPKSENTSQITGGLKSAAN